jgi:predicted ester cyclase
MSVEDNKALVRRWFDEVWNGGSAAAIDALAADDFVLHHSGRPGQPIDLATYRQLHGALRVALPDFTITIDDCIAEGDRVAARLSQTATHLGAYGVLQPSGTRLSWTALVMLRVRDGRLAEAWGEEDWHSVQAWLASGSQVASSSSD